MSLENKLGNLSLDNNETNINNVLTIKTVQIAPFRILMTALKDILFIFVSLLSNDRLPNLFSNDIYNRIFINKL